MWIIRKGKGCTQRYMSVNLRAVIIEWIRKTNMLYVSNPKKTRSRKGAKRIKLQGIGQDKAQITVTLAVTETGKILPPQLIFKGKTTKCHPKEPPPSNGYYTQTESHWQTPQSFKEWIEKVIVPYRTKTIEELKLVQTQKLLLILDLHYSHKDKVSALEVMERNNIVPVFIPAGCTDKLQVLDVCCNRPFKCAARKAFRDHVHLKFNHWHQTLKLDPELFVLPTQMSALKPHMSSFVEKGFNALATPEMEKSIAKCFMNEGKLGECRSTQRISLTQASLGLVLRLVVPEGEEIDEDSDGFYDDEDEED
jgi:hypothetical protein